MLRHAGSQFIELEAAKAATVDVETELASCAVVLDGLDGQIIARWVVLGEELQLGKPGTYQ